MSGLFIPRCVSLCNFTIRRTPDGRKITSSQLSTLYRKIKPEDIFTGTEFTGPGHVLVVKDDGMIEAIIPEREAGDTENCHGILSPGFVNAHCHIELSHLENKIPKHTGLVDFVGSVMKIRTESAEIKEAAMNAAEQELFAGGTVAVGDICNTSDSILLKQTSSLYWQNFVEVSGFVPAGAQMRFDAANNVLQQFLSSGLINSSITPHAPYSVSAKLFSLINDVESNNIISIHNQETAAENQFFKNATGDMQRLFKSLAVDISEFKGTGKSSLQSWLPFFTKKQRVISVHNTFTDDEDLNFARENYGGEIYLCLCPNANLYIENTLPDIEMLAASRFKLVIGTDSYASNTELNIYSEIKTIRENFPDIELSSLLKWATLNGAEALGIEGIFGSFEPGKRPGIVQIQNDTAKRIL